jgi:hypothetical protein
VVRWACENVLRGIAVPADRSFRHAAVAVIAALALGATAAVAQAGAGKVPERDPGCRGRLATPRGSGTAVGADVNRAARQELVRLTPREVQTDEGAVDRSVMPWPSGGDRRRALPPEQ